MIAHDIPELGGRMLTRVWTLLGAHEEEYQACAERYGRARREACLQRATRPAHDVVQVHSTLARRDLRHPGGIGSLEQFRRRT